MEIERKGMDEESRLLIAILQIENIKELIKGNPYQKMLEEHRSKMYYELTRQLKNLKSEETKTEV